MNGGTIVVLSPNWLGDAVMALPAVADVRAAAPSARLIVAARSSTADLFRLVPVVDDVVTLEWKGRIASWRALERDVERLRTAGAHTALLLPNSFAAAWLARRAGIRERCGYRTDWRAPLLTRAVPRPRGSVHQGAYYQQLTTALGFAPGPLTPQVRVPESSRDAAGSLLSSRGWDGSAPVVVIAPGAAYGTAKRWIPGHVAGLATRLMRERGAICVFVGSHGDRATVAQVIGTIDSTRRSAAVDLSGETTLEMLAAVLSLAGACVSNDSGAMHLAGAVGAPVVAIFGPTRERETAPLRGGGQPIEIITQPVWCRPCMLRECPIDHRCMTRITPDRVFAAVDRILEGTAS